MPGVSCWPSNGVALLVWCNVTPGIFDLQKTPGMNIWLWVKTNGTILGSAPPILVYFSGWIGMFTGGTIWILTHGHLIRVFSEALQPSDHSEPFLDHEPHL